MTEDEKTVLKENCCPAEEEVTGDEQEVNEESTEENNETVNEIEALNKQIEDKEKELKSYVELSQRLKAEFENYKKRTAREKEQLYTDILSDIVSMLLPVIDNMERAASSDSEDNTALMEGLSMILKQLKDILKKEGVEEIDALGNQFDPSLHNAVMHVEDESYDVNTVVEVFQKGYRIKDKVIRHSMVKVAN